MSEPIVFISHFRIKKGSLETLNQLSQRVTADLKADKPRTLLYLSYVDSDGTTISFLHAFADAESMDLHIEGAQERVRAAYEHVEPLGWDVYGKPSAAALEMLRQAAASSSVSLALHSEYVAGFVRLGLT